MIQGGDIASAYRRSHDLGIRFAQRVRSSRCEALAADLKRAGLHPFLYDAADFRPLAQIGDYKSVENMLIEVSISPTDELDYLLNIGNIGDAIERADYFVLIDEATRIDGIASQHVRNEATFARLLCSVRSRSSPILKLTPAMIRDYVLDKTPEKLRQDLDEKYSSGRRWLNYPNLRRLLGGSQLITVAAMIFADSTADRVICFILIVLALVLIVVGRHCANYLVWYSRAVLLGEVNEASPLLATIQPGLSQALTGDVAEALEEAVRQRLVRHVEGLQPLRKGVAWVVVGFPGLLHGIMPFLALASLAYAVYVLL